MCGWLHDLSLLSQCVKECETSALYLEQAWHDINENFMTWFVNNAGIRYQNFYLRTAIFPLPLQFEKYNRAIMEVRVASLSVLHYVMNRRFAGDIRLHQFTV